MPSVGASALTNTALGNPSAFLIYTEDVPCKPTPSAAHPVAHRVRLHRVRRPAAPEGVTPIPIVNEPAVQMSLLPPPAAKPHHHHRALAHHRPTVAAAAPKGCVALRSEPLNSASLTFYGAPAPTLDFPAALLAYNLPDLDLSSRRKFYVAGVDFPISDSDEWGGATAGPVRAVPEPQTWMLMILGVGLCGAALRRGRRAVRFGV